MDNIIHLSEDLGSVKDSKPISETDNVKSSEEGVTMDILFNELKNDMREREQRMEQRYQEQQEILLTKIDNKLDQSLSELRLEVSTIKQDIKDVKNSNFRWGVGLIVTIVIALIGALPQIINTIVELVKLIPNP